MIKSQTEAYAAIVRSLEYLIVPASWLDRFWMGLVLRACRQRLVDLGGSAHGLE